MSHVDSGDYTTDWWALPGAMGGLGTDVENALTESPTLYGTIHDGTVHGLAIADTPKNVKEWQWQMARHMAELAAEVRSLRREVSATRQRLDDMEADS